MFTQRRNYAAEDPYWSNVILMLHGEGSNGGTTITDSSVYAHTGTVIALTTSTAQAKYGSSSLLFDAASGSYVEYTATSEWLFGANDFTLEAWVYPTSVDATRRSLWDFRFDGSGAGTAWAVDYTSGDFRFQVGIGATLYSDNPATTLTANTWQHIACARDSGTLRYYKNGTQIQTATGLSTGSVNDKSATAKVRIGRRNDGTQNYGGYQDEVRFTRDVCRYPNGTTFTPATAAFPNG